MMNATDYKRLIVTLVVAILALSVFTWNRMWKYSENQMETRATWNFIAENEIARKHFDQIGTADMVEYLEIFDNMKGRATNFKNYDLSLIWEKERTRMIQDVINNLRKKTGDDLGEAPDAWIKKYGYGSTNVTHKATVSN